MRQLLSISLSLISSFLVFSQPNPTDAGSIIEAYENKEILVKSSRVKNIEFKNIGPTKIIWPPSVRKLHPLWFSRNWQGRIAF